MKEQTLIHKPLPQNPDIWVSIPDYKEPTLPIEKEGLGWYGLQAYDFEGDKLMCHECGKFFDNLAIHIRKHKLNPHSYADKYMLLRGNKLISKKESNKLSDIFKNRMGEINYAERAKQARAGINQDKRREQAAISRRCAEFQNKYDTCSNQVLRKLAEASKIYGEGVNRIQTDNYYGGLSKICAEKFGSFNKAKQLLKLRLNPQGSEIIFTDRLILEDIVSFYRKTKKWPTFTDYKKGLMICSPATLRRGGGIVKLRQEAQQLKDEQDKIASIDINAIANKIEMEYAGRARV
uniref:Putative ROS/MUCR transcriptional regulator protein n=1 Tax=viral metagenome TaxID=1070528 RepID=A0A6M3LFP1_9ZZZZ